MMKVEDSFSGNWRTREESLYNHWTDKTPINQIQLAFRNHWEVFKGLIGREMGLKVLEVGCGRGSISSYFAQYGNECHLLDYSIEILTIAEGIFRKNGHGGSFVCADANILPYKDDSFDVTVSIGLLEHFEDVNAIIGEQIRVLRPGGMFLGYVVPESPDNIQRYFRPVNRILRNLIPSKKSETAKTDIYRSDRWADYYLEIIRRYRVSETGAFGLYPMPMISHSPEFPFSLLPSGLEHVLVGIFGSALKIRSLLYRRHPWICSERIGQAFLIHCKKGEG